MTREDFLGELRSALSGEVSQLDLNENINYYEHYFNEQERNGRTEEDILEELGNPRLIARTIIDTNIKSAHGESFDQGYDPEHEEEEDRIRFHVNGKEYHNSIRNAKVAIWMIIIIALLIIIGVVAIVANVIGFLAPVLVPLLLIALAIRLITRK